MIDPDERIWDMDEAVDKILKVLYEGETKLSVMEMLGVLETVKAIITSRLYKGK